MSRPLADSFDLQRFLGAQQDTYPVALAELRRGSKRSHWMWFIFPQVAGLGTSEMARRYAIRSPREATAYLAHPLLGARLLECSRALLAVSGKTAEDILGHPDHLKLQSSMTLFAAISADGSLFHQVIQRYFSGAWDERTVDFLHKEADRLDAAGGTFNLKLP